MDKDTRFPHLRTPMMERIDELKEKGFGAEFQLTEQGLKCFDNNKIYQPSEIQITDFARFEGITNPDDMAILYAIETNDGVKGTITDAYGLYSDDNLGEFIKQVEIHDSQGSNT